MRAGWHSICERNANTYNVLSQYRAPIFNLGGESPSGVLRTASAILASTNRRPSPWTCPGAFMNTFPASSPARRALAGMPVAARTAAFISHWDANGLGGICTGVKGHAAGVTATLQLIAGRECRALQDPLGIAGHNRYVFCCPIPPETCCIFPYHV